MHVDRLMRSGTSECLIDIAHALAQNDFREVVRITLDVMPHVLDRYIAPHWPTSIPPF